MEKTTFINELGNKILIKVSEINSEGEMAGKFIEFDGVSILIRGPKSESENIITWMEATKLYDILGKFIKTNGYVK